MRSLAAVTALLLLSTCAPRRPPAGPSQAPLKVIFDSDMDSDCDDVGALAVLHALADRGEAEILATMVSSLNEWSAPAVDVINTFYGRPDLPIGVPRGPGASMPSRYAQQLAERFPHDLGSGQQALGAAELYRRILMEQPDDSVVIVTVGYLTNIAELLQLPAAGPVPAGRDVVQRKVRTWVCMGGNFVGSPARDDLKLGNNNFTVEKAGALHAVTRWPGRLVFVGREIGSVPSGLRVGARLVELPESNPVRMGYQHWFGGVPKDRHVADQTAVLFAVRGLRDYWEMAPRGTMDLQPDMTFEWRQDPDGRHGYLLKRQDDVAAHDRRIEAIIEELMLQPPRRPGAP